jgi:hypothetical protein
MRRNGAPLSCVNGAWQIHQSPRLNDAGQARVLRSAMRRRHSHPGLVFGWRRHDMCGCTHAASSPITRYDHLLPSAFHRVWTVIASGGELFPKYTPTVAPMWCFALPLGMLGNKPSFDFPWPLNNLLAQRARDRGNVDIDSCPVSHAGLGSKPPTSSLGSSSVGTSTARLDPPCHPCPCQSQGTLSA